MLHYRDRTIHHKWFALFSKHDWLAELCDSLAELKQMCTNQAEEHLVCDLIDRFHFVTVEERKQCISEIVSQIINRWELSDSDTVLVATTIDNDADSAQYIAQCIKPIMKRQQWENVRIINNFGKCCQLDCIIKYKNIVFIDEFIGSGTTILNRVDQFRKTVDEYHRTGRISFREHSLKVCVLACMEHARPLIQNKGVDLFAPLWLKKGIAGYYPIRERYKAYRAILQLEKQLDRSKDKNDIFPCGYKKSETLYAMDEGNAVNNLFPIFWWPYARDKKQRQTLFYRKGT